MTLTACGQTDQTFTKPIYVVKIIFPDGTSMITATTGGVADWNTLLNKPLLFPPAVHNHDGVYRRIDQKIDYNLDIINLPQQISLTQAIENLGYLPIPERTTTELTGLVLRAGS
jgi:hypothetical protein